MPKITVIRPYEWMNQTKNINVYIDGQKAGHVGIDKTVHFDVSPGKHNVVLRNNWLGSSQPLEVDLGDNEDCSIKMTTTPKAFMISMGLILFSSFAYPTARLFLNKVASLVIAPLFVLLVAGLIIFPLFRKNYLKLEEVKAIAKPKKTITKAEQARLRAKIMAADEKDGLYHM